MFRQNLTLFIEKILKRGQEETHLVGKYTDIAYC